MNKNKNIVRACGGLTRIVTQFFVLAGPLATAQAADEPVPAATIAPSVATPEAVDVEVFRGVRIRSAPTGDAYPREEVRDGREGWVQLDMMIDPHGKPYEVMVVDSNGNPAFEKAALKLLQRTTFEPARRGNTPIDSSFMMKMKFAIAGLAPGASAGFVGAYRRFVNAIQAGDKESADAQRAKLQPQNLYEEAFANYGTYFYHTKWGTPAEQLTDLRLAIAGEKRPEYLPREAFANALIAMFNLETKAHNYGDALRTWEILEPVAPKSMRADLQRVVDQINAIRLSGQPVTLSVSIDQTNNWEGTLFRNQFSITVTSGAVSEMKA